MITIVRLQCACRLVKLWYICINVINLCVVVSGQLVNQLCVSQVCNQTIFHNFFGHNRPRGSCITRPILLQSSSRSSQQTTQSSAQPPSHNPPIPLTSEVKPPDLISLLPLLTLLLPGSYLFSCHSQQYEDAMGAMHAQLFPCYSPSQINNCSKLITVNF